MENFASPTKLERERERFCTDAKNIYSCRENFIIRTVYDEKKINDGNDDLRGEPSGSPENLCVWDILIIFVTSLEKPRRDIFSW